MAGLRERNVYVPEDKSIVGFDDNCLCRLTHPCLTTIRQDAEQKGIIAAEMILAQLKHRPVAQRSVLLPVHLVERESVKRI